MTTDQNMLALSRCVTWPRPQLALTLSFAHSALRTHPRVPLRLSARQAYLVIQPVATSASSTCVRIRKEGEDPGPSFFCRLQVDTTKPQTVETFRLDTCFRGFTESRPGAVSRQPGRGALQAACTRCLRANAGSGHLFDAVIDVPLTPREEFDWT